MPCDITTGNIECNPDKPVFRKLHELVEEHYRDKRDRNQFGSSGNHSGRNQLGDPSHQAVDSSQERQNRSQRSGGRDADGEGAFIASFISDDQLFDTYARGMQRGDDTYASRLLEFARLEKKDGWLSKAAEKLVDSGKASVKYENGEVSHLIFNARDGGTALDVDVNQKTINGRSADEYNESANKRILQFVDAVMSKAGPGEPKFSPDVVEHANKFAKAILQGNLPELNSAYQEISANPELQGSVAQALGKGLVDGMVKFDPAKATMTITNNVEPWGNLVLRKDLAPQFESPGNCDLGTGLSRIGSYSSVMAGVNLQVTEEALSAKKLIPRGQFPSPAELRERDLDWKNREAEQRFFQKF